VCLSVCEDTCGTTHDLYQFFVHVAYFRGSILLWRRCDTLWKWNVWKYFLFGGWHHVFSV